MSERGKEGERGGGRRRESGGEGERVRRRRKESEGEKEREGVGKEVMSREKTEKEKLL